jgi:hypothetical protein
VTFSVSGADCNGSAQLGNVTGVNYHTSDFCVELGDACDATVRTKGWKFAGTSGSLDCSGNGSTSSATIEGVKDIRLGSGLYFEDYSDGICCSGNYVTIGSVGSTLPQSVKEYGAGGEYWSPTGCEGVLQVSGCSGISTAISPEGVLSICYTGATGGGSGSGGGGCSNSLSSVTAGGTTWNITGCEGALTVSGSGATSVSIDSNGNLIIGSTTGGGGGGGGGGGDCASGWGPIITNKDGMYPTDCNTALQIYGCSGITTSIRQGTGGTPYLEICQENFCSGLEPVKEFGAGGEYWSPTGCEGVLHVSGCSGISTDISSEGVLSVCYTGAQGCTLSGKTVGLTGDLVLTNVVDYNDGSTYRQTIKADPFYVSAPGGAEIGCGTRTWDSHNGLIISGASDANNMIDISTSAYSLIADDNDNYAIGENYAQHGSEKLNWLRIKGSGDVYTHLLGGSPTGGSLGATQDTTILIGSSGLSSLSVTGRNNCDPNEAYKTYTGATGTILNFGDGFLVSGAGDQVTIDQCCTAGISSGRGDVGSYGFGKIGNSYCEELIIKGRSGIQTVWDSNELYIGYTGAAGGGCNTSISTISVSGGAVDFTPTGCQGELIISGCGGIECDIVDNGDPYDDKSILKICYTGATGGGGGGAICPDAIENISSSDYSSTSSALTIDVVSAYADFNESCWVIGDRVCVHAENSAGTAIYLPATVSSFSSPNLELAGDFADHGGIKDYTPASSTIDLYHGPCAMSGNALEQTITLCIGGVNQEGNVLFNPS